MFGTLLDLALGICLIAIGAYCTFFSGYIADRIVSIYRRYGNVETDPAVFVLPYIVVGIATICAGVAFVFRSLRIMIE